MVLTSNARAGCSYFGVRIVRHVRRDLADLAARGYSGVMHRSCILSSNGMVDHEINVHKRVPRKSNARSG